jgi:tetratricopeptide (TPR) repeat protein
MNNKMKNNMKNFKIVLLLIGTLFILQNTFAQKGKIASAQLSLDEGKVLDAKKDIDAALMDAEVQKMSKAWVVKGNVYSNIYETKLYYPQNPKCLFDSKDAFMKALELELNPKKHKDIYSPLNTLYGYLFNEGFERFNGKKYDDAYTHFKASMEINEFLFSKGFASALDTNAIFATAMAGVNINKTEEIVPLLERLVAMDYDNAAVFETLAQWYEIKGNKEALSAILTKGLKKYPANKNLQIYELNATLDSGELESSIEKFKTAAENDPKNASILFNLAVLYDKAGNIEKTIETYERAIAVKSDYGDAYFNLGVLFFNQGVELNKKMNAIDEKDDKDGKKYEALKKQRDDIFAKSLPFLEKAYAINPKNPDYKLNLKKVYASMNMLEKAKALSEE